MKSAFGYTSNVGMFSADGHEGSALKCAAWLKWEKRQIARKAAIFRDNGWRRFAWICVNAIFATVVGVVRTRVWIRIWMATVVSAVFYRRAMNPSLMDYCCLVLWLELKQGGFRDCIVYASVNTRSLMVWCDYICKCRDNVVVWVIVLL